MRIARPLYVTVAAAAAAILSATTASAQPAPQAHASASAGGTVDREHALVGYFGYDGEETYTSPLLDASDPKAKDPANWVPRSLVDGARGTRSQPPKPDTFLCTLWVGEVVANGLYDVKAGTSQDCSGSFRTQWTQAQFAEDNGGWHRVTGSIVGPSTSGQHNDTTFGMACNQPPQTGRHKLRLEARGYAVDADGTQVRGTLLYGKSSSWTCI
ncbi:hypothetical protein [Streptomyces sp. BPTC-684]|uniref:hypothetical protein n=1 Tax=Streptomyces sp. BPTC-684 TaxID=3043734 RepID=UPI0024B11827|nr:hypothetical protein [Streptomyces sp. BPTC-684]WHM38154.1 hypothetical protein QIY60_15340 [Streptomyces sp. BPTC-684]